MTEREKLIEAMARGVFNHWQFQAGSVLAVAWVAGGNSTKQGEARDYATAALSAIEASGAVVVPVEATGVMLESADDALCGVAVGDLAHDIAGDTYAAMLAASPYAKEPT